MDKGKKFYFFLHLQHLVMVLQNVLKRNSPVKHRPLR
jgi:hypothetical protein